MGRHDATFSTKGSVINVLFITHYVALYGANRSLLTLLNGRRDAGIRVAVLSPAEGPITRCAEEAGARIFLGDPKIWALSGQELARYNWKGRFYLFRKQLMGLWRVDATLYSHVSEFRPDIVYSNSSVCAAGVAIARKLKKPHVWHLREYGKEDYDLRFVIGNFLARSIIGRSDAVVAVSNSLRRHFFGTVPRKHIRVIYNGVAPRDYVLRNGPAKVGTEEPFRLLMVGLLSPRKGQDLAIRALATVNREKRRVKLTLIGNGAGAEMRRLSHLAAELGVAADVEFLGYIEKPLPEFIRHDCLIMASEKEAMGRVTVEAMLLGLAVIGRNAGATPELVKDGETGYLFDDGERGLAEAIERALNEKRQFREMGRIARQEALSKFTEEEYVGRVVNVIEEVCGR